MKVVINGAGFVNKGAEAMARTVQTELARRLPDCEFFLWRPTQRDCRPALNGGFSPFQLPFDRKNEFWSWSRGRRFGLLFWSLLELGRTWDFRNIHAAFAPGRRLGRACGCYLRRSGVDFGVLVDISGFAYGDAWGTGDFRRIEPLMEYFRSTGRPVVFMPQAWGAFDEPPVRQALRQLLGHENTSFYSRDERSCRYLEQALEKPAGSVSVTPDIVFGFQGGTLDQGEHLLRNMGCALGRPIVGLAPNVRAYERASGKGMRNSYLQALVKLVEHCQSNHEIDMVLQANEIASADDQLDDRYLCSLIAAKINNPRRCFMTRESLTAEATKALVGRFDYLIGSRFHSLVFAFSQGVPGMGLGWSHKYRELFSLFGMEDRVQECQQSHPEALIEMFEKGWAERKERREHILKKAKQLQEGVTALFDEVAEKIRGRYAHKKARDDEGHR